MYRTAMLIACLLFATANGDGRFDRYIRKGKLEKALKYVDRKYPQDERTTEMWFKVAKLSEQLKLNEKAIGCYLAILVDEPKNYEILSSIARLYYKIEKYPNALVMARRALELKKEDDEANWQYAKCCLALNSVTDAEPVLTKIAPRHYEARKALGLMYYDRGDYDESIKLLQECFDEERTFNDGNGFDSEVTRKIAQYYVVNDCKKAIKYLEYYVKATNDRNGILDLARCYFKTEKYVLASEAYAKIDVKELDYEDYYQIGVIKEIEEKPEEALLFYKKALEKSGDDSEIHLKVKLKLGLLYLENKQFGKALENLKYVEANGNSKGLDLHLARAYEGLKKYEIAGKYGLEHIKKYPKNIRARLIVANSYEKKDFKTKAQIMRNTVIDMDPHNANIHFEMGEYYFENQKFAQAIRFYEKSYLLDQVKLALERIAICAYRIDQFDKAKDAAESALESDENSVPARQALYRVYMRESNYQKAVIHLEHLVKLDEDNLGYYKRLLACYEKLGSHEQILRIDERIIALDSKNISSRRRVANHMMTQKKYKEALELFDHIIGLQKATADDYPNVIVAANNLKLGMKRIDYLQQYCRLKPRDPAIYKQIGDIYYEAGNEDSTILNYRIALTYEPYVRGIYRNYSKVHAKKKMPNLKAVIELSEKAVEHGEGDFEVYANLGNAYLKQQSYDRALLNFRKANMERNDDMDVFKNLAYCQVKTGKTSEAIISYEQIVQMLGEEKEHYKTLGDLYLSQEKEKIAIDNYKKYLEKFNDDAIVTRVAMYEYWNGSCEEALKYFPRVEKYSNPTLFAYGECLIKSEEYAKSIDVLQRFCRKYPKHRRLIAVHRYLGIAYEETRNVGEAIRYYKMYVNEAGDFDIAYKVGVLFESVDSSEAERTYAQNTTRFPNDYRNYVKLGQIHRKNVRKARAMYEKAVEINDTLLHVWENLGLIYDELKDEKNKLRVYKKVIVMDPQNFEANKYIGMTLYIDGKEKEALLYLELARSKQHEDGEILFTLGKIYIGQKKHMEAEMLLRSAKNLLKRQQDVRFTLVKHYFETDQFDKALEESRELLETDDDNLYFLMHIDILFRLRRYKEAEREIRQRRKTNHENITYLMLLASAQRKDGRSKEAIETYKMIGYIKTDYLPGMLGRAEAYRELGNKDKAEYYYIKVLKRDDNLAKAHFGLAQVYKGVDQDKYLEYLKSAQRLDQNNPLIDKEFKEAMK